MRNKSKVTEADIRRVKRMTQRRNGLAGKGKGKSSARKLLYDAAFNSKPDRKKYRAKLQKARRASPAPKGYDKSHTKKGKIVNERASTNRARNKPGRSLK